MWGHFQPFQSGKQEDNDETVILLPEFGTEEWEQILEGKSIEESWEEVRFLGGIFRHISAKPPRTSTPLP